METEDTAPLDLRVKKEIKSEPKTPEGAPLNLSAPVKSVSPNLVSKGPSGGSDSVRVASEKASPVRTPRTSHSDHAASGVPGSKAVAVSPVGDSRTHGARPPMARGHPEDMPFCERIL